jgi:hypothetical protein
MLLQVVHHAQIRIWRKCCPPRYGFCPPFAYYSFTSRKSNTGILSRREGARIENDVALQRHGIPARKIS